MQIKTAVQISSEMHQHIMELADANSASVSALIRGILRALIASPEIRDYTFKERDPDLRKASLRMKNTLSHQQIVVVDRVILEGVKEIAKRLGVKTAVVVRRVLTLYCYFPESRPLFEESIHQEVYLFR